MDDFMTLWKRGIIYDGCPIVAKGTVRVKDGDLCIESMHNLMAVDGKSFEELCEHKGISRTEQGQITHDEEDLKSKVSDLAKENEALVEEMRKNNATLHEKLQHEYTLRTSFEEHLGREKKISEHATQVILDAQAKLAAQAEQVCDLQAKLDESEILLRDRDTTASELQVQLDELTDTMRTKCGQVVAMQAQLDSTGLVLSEKDDKLRLLQQQVGEYEIRVRAMELREREARVQLEGVQRQLSRLEEERTVNQFNSDAILHEYKEWKLSSEKEISELRQELEHSKTTITTLKNELEIAELEDSEYHQTIVSLQKENDHLKSDMTRVQEPEKPMKKLKSQHSLRNLLKGISKPKDQTEEKEAGKDKKEKKERKDTRSSIASALSM